MRSLVVDPQAVHDLDAASIYIAERNSEERALRFLDAATETFQRLAEMPSVGSARPVRNPRLQGLRWWHVQDFNSYLIFYRFDDESVEILRVLYGARDIDSILESGTEEP